MHRAAIAAAVVAGSLALPATAAAHLRTGRVAVDYEATVAPLQPPVAQALAVRVYRADLALGLRVSDHHRVVVLGYTGEPFLRLGAGGTYASRSSLTAAGLGLVGPHSGTGWQLVSRARPALKGEFLKAVHFTHPEPPYRAEYERIFAAPLTFDADWNAMQVDEAMLNEKVQRLPGYAFGVLSERAEALLKALESSKSTRGRVEALLMPILHTGEASMDLIAEKMRLSRQTLFRRLKSEGVTFEQVLDELRHKLATHYLHGQQVSVNETAYLVGFSDPAAFSRAFKRWTGVSPSEARALKVAS